MDVEEMGEVEVVELVRAGESGSGGSSAGGDGCVNVCFAVTRSNNDARAFNRGRPKPSIRFGLQVTGVGN